MNRPELRGATDVQCVAFLRWALPRLHLSFAGFRKVRRQVCRRVERRRHELGLADLAEYRAYLEERPEEWARVDECCRVTISRFARDRRVFELLGEEVLPSLARSALSRGAEALEVWSAGCASGEEPYTLALVWDLVVAQRVPSLAFHVLATDVDADMLRRAREGCYESSSLKELPEGWREGAFVPRDGRLSLRAEFRRHVTFRRHDVRSEPPAGPFDLVLCRNLAFTYFDLELQRDVARRLAASLRPGGALVVGAHEAVPEDVAGLVPWPGARCVVRKQAA